MTHTQQEADAAAPVAFAEGGRGRPVRRRRGIRPPRLAPFLFTVVTAVLFALFFLWPAILGLSYSLTDYRGWGDATFVGLANYSSLFGDPDFYNSVVRTLLYTLISVPLGFALSLCMAVLLTSVGAKGKPLARVVFFLPWLVSPIVSGVIWRWLFGESFGFVNFVIRSMGGEAVPWSSNANLSLLVVVLASAWGGAAFNMLLFVAALDNVPRSYYEAAELDGASSWQRFRNITLPSIAPTSVMVLLLLTMTQMKEFALIQALNGGGPGTQNRLIVQYIYETGFKSSEIGYASAASMVLLVILMIIAVVQLRISRRTSES